MLFPGHAIPIFETNVAHAIVLEPPDEAMVSKIIKWDADSARVTFLVAKESIVVNVKELAAGPKARRAVQLSEAERGEPRVTTTVSILNGTTQTTVISTLVNKDGSQKSEDKKAEPRR
jgi:hypothetical protein